MTLLILLATFSLGSGQAVLHFDSLHQCELMRDRLLGLVSKGQSYVPFQLEVQGYCIPE